MVTRIEVVAEARSWLDTPYEHQHREKGHAVDCAGLLICTMRNLGLLPGDFDIQGYPRRPDGVSMMATCDKYLTRVAMKDLQPGDVMLLRFGNDPQHVGILGDYPHQSSEPGAPRVLSLIHAFSDTKPPRVVEHRMMRTKVMFPVQGYSMPGVE